MANNEVDNMEENRTSVPNKREMKAALNSMLAKLQCRHCSSIGLWKITKTGKGIRYIQCEACGRTSACSSNLDTQRTYSPSQLEEVIKKQKRNRR